MPNKLFYIFYNTLSHIFPRKTFSFICVDCGKMLLSLFLDRSGVETIYSFLLLFFCLRIIHLSLSLSFFHPRDPQIPNLNDCCVCWVHPLSSLFPREQTEHTHWIELMALLIIVSRKKLRWYSEWRGEKRVSVKNGLSVSCLADRVKKSLPHWTIPNIESELHSFPCSGASPTLAHTHPLMPVGRWLIEQSNMVNKEAIENGGKRCPTFFPRQ